MLVFCHDTAMLKITLMKKQILSFMLASTLTLGITGCSTCCDSAAWEYKAVNCTGDSQDVQKQIDNMTKEGWCFVSISGGGGDATHVPYDVLIFKRHK